MTRPRRISTDAARRTAIAAQGLAGPRPARAVTTRDLGRVLDTVGLVQIDSVNVLTRSHYLPFYSRLGAYDTVLLDRMRDRAPRRMVEYWAHEASLMPPSTWPLMEHPRMSRAEDGSWGGMQRVAREHPQLLAAVLAEVEAGPPRTARQLEAALGHGEDGGGSPDARDAWGWNWSLVKTALEHLFWAGRLSSAGRTAQFERRYASPGRVAPPEERRRWVDRASWPAADDAYEQLTRIAVRALGVATAADVADYFRTRRDRTLPALHRLLAAGEVAEVEVDGWSAPALLDVAARRPRAVHARALLSPFDSLVWCRPRVERLFDFHYRIEIYTPAERRVHGYYVLPFLLGDRLVARVDLKADRSAGALLAQQVTWEPGRGGPADAAELDAELASLAGWLRLSEVRRR